MNNKQKVGLILSGGAGKGSFEIGIIKGLYETGVLDYITGISGTSVGALNMALILSNNTMEENIRVWEKFSFKDLVDAKPIKEICKYLFAHPIGLAVSPEVWEYKFIKECIKNPDIHPSLSSQESLKKIIKELTFNDEKLTTMDLFSCVTDVSINSIRAAYISWNELNKYEISTVIRSSAGLPVVYHGHSTKKFGHIMYDGGIRNNTPIDPLYFLGYRRFIIVYLEPEHKLKKQIKKENTRFGDAEIFRIFPGKEVHKGTDTYLLTNQRKKLENIKLGEELITDMYHENQFCKPSIDWIPFESFRDKKDYNYNQKLMEKIERRIHRGKILMKGESYHHEE